MALAFVFGLAEGVTVGADADVDANPSSGDGDVNGNSAAGLWLPEGVDITWIDPIVFA